MAEERGWADLSTAAIYDVYIYKHTKSEGRSKKTEREEKQRKVVTFLPVHGRMARNVI